MARYNAWVSMSEELKTELWQYVKNDVPAVEFPAINDISEFTADFFLSARYQGDIERHYRAWTPGAKTYKLWTLYADKAEYAPVIRDDWDMLMAAYPSDFNIVGAWSYETGQEVGAGQGEVWYPIPPQAIHFMPDVIVDNSDPENPVYGRPTELSDTILLLGQAERDFGSFND